MTTMTSHKLWAEYYTPTCLKEVIGNNSIVSTIEHYIEAQQLPHMLLVGGHGLGKTTIAKLIAKQYLGQPLLKSHFMEIIGSIYRGKNVVSEKNDKKNTNDKGGDVPNIINFITKKTLNNDKCKLICIYDFDCMTTEAQMALRRIIELYSNRVRFMFVCNNINNVIEAIQSRTLLLKFNNLCTDEIIARLKQINGQLPQDLYTHIGIMCNGDLKQAINYLQVMSNYQSPTIEVFYNIFNVPNLNTINKLLDLCLNKQYPQAFALISQLIDNGYNSSDILDIIIKVLCHRTDIDNKTRVSYIQETSKVICINETTPSNTHLYRLIAKYLG